MKEILQELDVYFTQTAVDYIKEENKKHKSNIVKFLSKSEYFNSELNSIVYKHETTRTATNYEQATRNYIYSEFYSEFFKKIGLHLEAEHFEGNAITEAGAIMINDKIEWYNDYNCDFNISFTIRKGQKWNRIIRKLAEFFDYPINEKRFAQYSDYMTNSNDYITYMLTTQPEAWCMTGTNKHYGSSCHNLVDGGYRAGNLSYMQDEHTILLMSWDNRYNEPVDLSYECLYNKASRTILILSEDCKTLVKSRRYPDCNREYTEKDMEVVNKLLFDGSLNKRGLEPAGYIDCDNGLYYTDWTYPSYNSAIYTAGGADPQEMVLDGIPYCLLCGEEVTESENIHCDNCTTTQYTCYECEGRYNEDDVYYVESIREYVCGNCIDHYTRCNACGERHRVGDSTEVNGQQYCENCINDLFTECYSCDDYIKNDDIIEQDGDYYCQACYDDQFRTCTICDTVTAYEDITVIDGEYICDYCKASEFSACVSCGEFLFNERLDDNGECSVCAR